MKKGNNLKGNKLKIFKILQNNYLTKEQAEINKENYSQLNVWEEGELSDMIDVKAFDNKNYYDFDMFEKQISTILKNKLVDKIELEYGDYQGANTEWFTLYESK